MQIVGKIPNVLIQKTFRDLYCTIGQSLVIQVLSIILWSHKIHVNYTMPKRNSTFKAFRCVRRTRLTSFSSRVPGLPPF